MKRVKIVTEIPGPKSKELWKLWIKYVTKGCGWPGQPTRAIIDRAEGALITDIDGNVFIDFVSGVGVLNAGHCPPEVVDAIKKQAERFLHTCWGVFPYESSLRLAEKIVNITPGDFPKKIMYFNSGAEAVENAVKMSTYYTKKPMIISFEHSFHGRTLLTGFLTGKVKYRRGYKLYTPNVIHFPYAYCYRCSFGLNYPECAMRCVHYIEDSFLTHYPSEDISAILFEPIIGEGGFILPPDEFVRGLRKICDKNGIVMIADEIQSGMGRTGKWFCIEHYNVTPDMVTIAKSIASGIPLSVVVGKSEIMDAPHPGALGGTFNANPIACAAAIEVIQIIEKNLGHAQKIGHIIMKRLNEMKERYELVGDVRGRGPMAAIELVKDRKTKEPATDETAKVLKHCYENGLSVLSAGIYSNVVRILVPLVIDEETLNEGLDILDAAIKSIG